MTHPPFTADLPHELYTAKQVRELDRLTIAAGTPGFTLMTRAGEAAFSLLLQRWPQARRVDVVCGGGNNGGDGYVVARLAHQHGIKVSLYAVSSPERLQGDAKLAWAAACNAGLEVLPFDVGQQFEGDVIVDALLGTGLQGEVKAASLAAIEAMRQSSAPVLAIDIPSGLCADTGRVLGQAVLAAATITFIGMKIGLLTGNAPAHVGDLYFADLGVPEGIRDQVPADVNTVLRSQVDRWLPRRARDAHKGHFGHVLVVGGDLGMGGAVLMAAEAAARSGAGLVSVATRGEHLGALLSRRPELMVHPVADGEGIDHLTARATVIVLGPGLGQGSWGKQLFQQVIASNKPLVVDADGLNWLSHAAITPRANWVLTPHPGEAARLLQTDTESIQQHRLNAARALQNRYGGVIVLKGAGTVICDENQRLSLAAVGNPGMATGGMGDVLSGIIGALIAQKLSLADAAAIGVWLHGAAADSAAAEGERGMLATDLFSPLRHLVNGITEKTHGRPHSRHLSP